MRRRIVLDRIGHPRNLQGMSDFAKQIAALRGTPPPPPKARARPIELPDPTDVLTRRIVERSEAEICDRLGEWLRADGWEVFFEVPLDEYRPDVVGFKGDQTMAIEAKRVDVFGVIKQGLRVARRVDLPYVALPFGAADAVVLELARFELKVMQRGDGRRPPAVPGVLAVGATVIELRKPSGHPYKRLATAELREQAERFGAERGGVPSVDQTERNAEMWRRMVAGERTADIADAYRLSFTAARTALKRVDAWREHVLVCRGYPCIAKRPTDREFYAGAHKHEDILRDLPAKP